MQKSNSYTIRQNEITYRPLTLRKKRVPTSLLNTSVTEDTVPLAVRCQCHFSPT